MKFKITIIDRYILRHFFKTFIICFVSLAGLYIVFDLFTNLENFSKSAGNNGNLASLLASYYSYRTFLFLDLLGPMLTLTAAMFTVTWLKGHGEMTALLAAGIPRIRIATPIFAAALVMTLVSTVNREIIMPRCRYQLCRTPYDIVGASQRDLSSCWDMKTDILIDGAGTSAALRKIVRPSFVLPVDLGDYGNDLKADVGYYLAPKGKRPGGYWLDGVTEPADLYIQKSLVKGGEKVLITPADQPEWLQNDPRIAALRKKLNPNLKSPPGHLNQNECFVVSDVKFEMLTDGLTYASTAELISGLNNSSLDFGADVRVDIHSRLLHPFADSILLLLGLPIVLRRDSRNIFMATGLCMLIVSTFTATTMISGYFGTEMLISASLAAWLPLLLFVPLAVKLGYGIFE